MCNLLVKFLKLFFLVLSIGLVSCNNSQSYIFGKNTINTNYDNLQKNRKDDFLIIPGERLGPLPLNSLTLNDLWKTFGKQNVKTSKIYMGEGFYEEGYLVFPNSANEVDIVFDDSTSKKPILIRVKNELTDWHTNDGITIGTTLEDLVRINKAPISFLGFGWDYGGSVMDYNSGKISNKLKLSLGLTLEHTPLEFIGSQELQSDALEKYAKQIKVSTINLAYEE